MITAIRIVSDRDKQTVAIVPLNGGSVDVPSNRGPLRIVCDVDKAKGYAVVQWFGDKVEARHDLPAAPYEVLFDAPLEVGRGYDLRAKHGGTSIGTDNLSSPHKITLNVKAFPDNTPCVIEGVCFNDDDGDGKMDPGEKPSGVRDVELLPVPFKEGDVVTEVRSDENGYFVFPGVPAGTYQVRRKSYPTKYKSSSDTVVTLRPGQVLDVAIGTMRDSGTPAPVPVDPKPTPTPVPVRDAIVKGSVAVSDHDPATPVLVGPGTKMKLIDYLWSVVGIRDGREWHGFQFQPDDTRAQAGRFLRYKPWLAAGYDLTLLIGDGHDWNNARTYTAASTKESVKRLLSGAIQALGLETVQKRLRFEILNEPNLTASEYVPDAFFGQPKKVVDVFCNPAYEVLHDAGVRVVGASITYDTNYLRKMYEAGIQCDEQGFHFYQRTTPMLQKKLDEFKAIVGDRKCVESESGAFRGPELRTWRIMQANPGWSEEKAAASHPKAKLPAMSEQQVVAEDKSQWRARLNSGVMSVVHHFITCDVTEKHTTGQRMLLKATKKNGSKALEMAPTAFATDFWRNAAMK